MGRPRKPTALHLVNGNPGKRTLNPGEPEPDVLNDLEPPAHLAEDSATVWRELASMLRKIGVLTVADRIALEMLCDAVADYRHARNKVGPDFVKATMKGQMLNQWLVAQQMCGKRAEAFMAKFGMDPAARSRIMVNPQGNLFGNDTPGAPPPASASRFFTR